MDAHVASDGGTLYVTITDIVTSAVWSTSIPADIPALVGGREAYVGFTGSTNATGSSSQKIETWHYQGGSVTPAVTATPSFSLAAGTYATSRTLRSRIPRPGPPSTTPSTAAIRAAVRPYIPAKLP